MAQPNLAALIWSVADLLRGDYRQSDYGKVILPFTLLRRLDCTLEATKADVLAEYQLRKDSSLPLDPFLTRTSGVPFYNTSDLDFRHLLDDSANVKLNLVRYVSSFSENVRDIFERSDFLKEVDKLDEGNLLYLVLQRFATVDLHPDTVANTDMGLIFEELIRRFSELSNETAGEHYTPREVIRLMVDLLFIADEDVLTKPGIVRSLYDPAAGTGGMLSVAEEYLRALNPRAELKVFGQELNAESYAICKADMLIKDQDVSNVIFGNTLSNDGLSNHTFDYCLSNPPFGVEWKKVEREVREEHERLGYRGRFGPGLPRISDGAMLFLLHLISKMRPVSEGGSRIGIVLNGSPLFTGGAGSGESEIRRWIIENDWLECIVALPTDMFYNTNISTYIWILSNHKHPDRKGKIQLINAVDFYQKMRKSLGAKRKELGPEDIARIVTLYGNFEENEYSRIFDNEDFGYVTITVERPLKLNVAVAPERLGRLDASTPLTKLNGDLDRLKAALSRLGTDHVWKNRDVFQKVMMRASVTAGLSLSTPQVKALLQALSERDETADVCLDNKGRPEPDTDLRDTENVPLKEDARAYFDQEVLSHVPDAWIDHEKTRVGYEIPFTRHFYKYERPRTLEEIEQDLANVSRDIAQLLQGVIR